MKVNTQEGLGSVLFGVDSAPTGARNLGGILNAFDWKKILRHFLVSVAGFASSAALDIVAEQVIPGLHFGVLTATLTPLLSTGLETLRAKITIYLASQDTQ